jgi:Phospholipase_D-nuclease N-terminal
MWVWTAILCFGDIFGRHDIGGFAKVMWIILIVFSPLLGVLIYLIAYHAGVAERNAPDGLRLPRRPSSSRPRRSRHEWPGDGDRDRAAAP